MFNAVFLDQLVCHVQFLNIYFLMILLKKVYQTNLVI